MKKSFKKVLKEMTEGTFVVKKRGKKYLVHDVVDYGEPTLMTKKQVMRRFG